MTFKVCSNTLTFTDSIILWFGFFSWKDSSRCIRLRGICAISSVYCVHTGRWLGCVVEASWGNWQWCEQVWKVPAAHTNIRPAIYLLCPKILTGNRLFETLSWWVLLLLRETQVCLVQEDKHQGWELSLPAVFTEPCLGESSPSKCWQQLFNLIVEDIE